MTIPMWSLLAGIFVPYIWAFGSLSFRLKQLGEVAFRYPRRQAENLVHAVSSVVGAQFNVWKHFLFFASRT
jgi:hypothetical protein